MTENAKYLFVIHIDASFHSDIKRIPQLIYLFQKGHTLDTGNFN